MVVRVLTFEILKELYNADLNFVVWENIFLRVLLIISWSKKVFFSKATNYAILNVLCKGQLSKKLVKSLARHVGREKIFAHARNFYWPKLTYDVMSPMRSCKTCQIAKSHNQNTGLYIPFPIPKALLEDINLDFVLCLPQTQRNKDSILVLVDRFSKISFCSL